VSSTNQQDFFTHGNKIVSNVCCFTVEHNTSIINPIIHIFCFSASGIPLLASWDKHQNQLKRENYIISVLHAEEFATTS
jgi:hypothetical protein